MEQKRKKKPQDAASKRENRLEIRLFGHFAVRRNDQPVSFPRHSAEQLLALLALELGQPKERLWLAQQLWPEEAPVVEAEVLRTRLRSTLSTLRNALALPAGQGLMSPDQDRLVLTGVWVDVAEFEAASGRGDEASLRYAAELYRGRLLKGWNFEWLAEAERDRFTQICREVLEGLAERAAKRRELLQAEGYLVRAIDLDPLHEPSSVALMRVLAAQKEFTRALAVGRVLRRRLYEELREQPSPETTALMRQLLDLAHQYEQQAPRSLADELKRRPTYMVPQPSDRFINRLQEVAEVQSLLDDRHLLTLTGLGGMGKTRIAIQVAQEAVSGFADGAWWVDLSEIEEGELVLERIVSKLEVGVQSASPLWERLREHLKRKQLLLILDRCEGVAEACAQLTADLVRECADLRILITSRVPLQAPGEICYEVIPLDENSAPELFVERTSPSERALVTSEQNAPLLADLCWQLDGIPLAIELAAARTGLLSLAEILVQLADRFSFLTRRRRGAPRQAVLREVIDWSYTKLPSEAQTLFRRLSVFAGGWSLEAAAAVCNTDGLTIDLLDLMEELLDVALVRKLSVTGEARFHLLEAPRVYARDKLKEAGETIEVRNRHHKWCLRLTMAAEMDPDELGQKEWLDRLEREHENFQVALAWSLAADEAHAGLALAARLGWFWEVRGYWTEGRAWLERLLAEAPSDTPPILQASGRHTAGWLAFRQGDIGTAQTLLEESLRIYQALDSPDGIEGVSNSLGLVLYEQGDITAARELFTDCLASARQRGDQASMAATLISLGKLKLSTGDYPEAISQTKEALDLMGALGDQGGVALCLNNLGEAYRLQGLADTARALYNESAVTYEEAGDRSGSALARSNLALVSVDTGPAGEVNQVEEVLAQQRNLGDKAGIATSLHNLGVRKAIARQWDEAFSLLEESLQLWREVGDLSGIAATLHTMGEVAQQRRDLSVALAHSHESLAIYEKLGDKRGRAWCLQNLGQIDLLYGRYGEARRRFLDSMALFHQISDRRGMIVCLERFALLSTYINERERAARLFGAAAAHRQAHSFPLTAADEDDIQSAIRVAISALGEAAYTAAWQVGQALPLEEAIKDAVGEE